MIYRTDLRGLADWLEYNADIQRNHPLSVSAAWGDKLAGWAREVRRVLASEEHLRGGCFQERGCGGRRERNMRSDMPVLPPL